MDPIPKDEGAILTETVKLLSVAAGSGNRVTQLLAKLFMKQWTTREIHLIENSQPKGYVLKYCHKTSDTVDTVCVPLDEVITVRHLDNLKKKNVLEIMFPHHSILLSFKSFTIMERWLSELINVASTFVLFLMKSSNRSIKLGYYLLQFYVNKMIFYDLINKEMVWMWDVSHIHSYQYRKTLSELDIVVGRFPDNKSGYFTFTGKRLGLMRQQMHTLALKALSSTDEMNNKVIYIPSVDRARSNVKQLHEYVPCVKNSPQPVSKPDSPTPTKAKSAKKKSTLRGSYSLNCLDEISIDNAYVDEMDCSHDPKVFKEHVHIELNNTRIDN